MRLIATLIIIIIAGLPALFAGWPGKSPGLFDARIAGIPGSVLVMSLLLLAFILIAALSSGVARKANAADQEAGQ